MIEGREDFKTRISRNENRGVQAAAVLTLQSKEKLQAAMQGVGVIKAVKLKNLHKLMELS